MSKCDVKLCITKIEQHYIYSNLAVEFTTKTHTHQSIYYRITFNRNYHRLTLPVAEILKSLGEYGSEKD